MTHACDILCEICVLCATDVTSSNLQSHTAHDACFLRNFQEKLACLTSDFKKKWYDLLREQDKNDGASVLGSVIHIT